MDASDKQVSGRPAWWTNHFDWGLSQAHDELLYSRWFTTEELSLDPTAETAKLLFAALWSLGKTVPGPHREDSFSWCENLRQLEYQVRQAQAISRRRRCVIQEPQEADEEEAFEREAEEEIGSAVPRITEARITVAHPGGPPEQLAVTVEASGSMTVVSSGSGLDYESRLALREAFTVIGETLARQVTDPVTWQD
ncbi:hypothetical protein ACFZC3_15645 [Streptomyces sp. NPDC007903]|uniref:hypothetical protein n=1 Tax=Streptomyces sp. NPDC007903 TaxID=3364786 RepID=UPI0036EE2ED7